MKEVSSNIPSVSIPVFEACIPEHLLRGVKSESTKWMIEQVSEMQQGNQWQNKKIHDIYEYTRKINGQVIMLKEFRSDLLRQMEAEHKLDQIRETNKKQLTKLHKIIIAMLLTVVYPLFLAQWTSEGVLKIISLLW